MLSISGAMTAGDSLTAYFVGGNEDYYMSSAGEWQGTGAAALGLQGEVSRDQFRLMAGGFSPATGEQLVSGKKVTDEKGTNRYHKQAGNDFTFSAGKSISIAAAFDPRIKSLHEQAVSKVVDFMENNNTQARQQVEGCRIIKDTGNLVSAKFTHITSRDLDPQLHTHVFVFNMTQSKDGAWRALINRSMFQDKMALGKFYRNELSKNLKDAGYRLKITDRDQGFFKIQGVPKKLEEHFSKRRKEIRDKIKDPVFQKMIHEKYPSAEKSTIYQIATIGTRRDKKKVTAEEIKKHWQKEIESKGYTIDGIKHSIELSSNINTIQTETGTNRTIKKAIHNAIQTITETNTIFTKSQVLKAATDQNFGVHKLENLDKKFNSSKIIKKIGHKHGRDYYTSLELLKIEESIIKAARSGKGKRIPLASQGEVNTAIDFNERKNGWSYTRGQKQTIEALATSRDKIIVVQGDAGTGKTASMKVLKHIADTKGYTVKGLGFTGKSADELEKGAGIRSQTIDSFLPKQNNSSKAFGDEIWLVDESSMAGSRHYSEILVKAKKQNSTVVFLGDTKQFQSIAAGRMFHDLQSAIGTHAELTEVMRQKTPETRAVVSKLNAGKPEKAFNLLEKQGNLKKYKSRNDLQRATVQHYHNASIKGKKSTVVITSSNADRQVLNHKIKAALVQSGQVKQGSHHTVLSPHNIPVIQAGLASSYRESQVVQANKSIPGSLKAGQSGEIVGINHDQNTIIVQNGLKQNSIDIDKHYSQLSVFDKKTINLSQGDRIIFGKNDRKLNVKNGQIGKIRDIDSHGNVAARVGKKIVKFSLLDQNQKQPGKPKYSYPHIDHGYAITTHKSQGATFNNVIWHAPSKGGKDRQINRRVAYVAATRARDKFTILTDDKKRLREAVSKDKSKASIADFEQEFKSQFKLKNIQNKIKSAEHEAKSHRPKVNMEIGH